MKIERRNSPILIKLHPFFTIVVALLLGSVILFLLNIDILKSYEILFSSAFGSLDGIGESLTRAVPLIFVGLAVAIPRKAGLWNIGGEGQLHLGAMFAFLTANAVLIPGMSIFSMTVVGFIAGGLLGMVAGVLKIKRGVNEILSTVMLNFILLYIFEFLVIGPWRDTTAAIMTRTAHIPEVSTLTKLFGMSRLNASFFLAVLTAIVVYIFLSKTSLGFKIRAVGSGEKTSIASGINKNKIILIAMFLGGGLAAMAGVFEVAGVHYYLIKGFSPGFGFWGIAVCMLSGVNSLVIIGMSIFFGGMIVGLFSMTRLVDLPVAMTDVFLGLMIIGWLITYFVIHYRIRWIK